MGEWGAGSEGLRGMQTQNFTVYRRLCSQNLPFSGLIKLMNFTQPLNMSTRGMFHLFVVFFSQIVLRVKHGVLNILYGAYFTERMVQGYNT